MGLYIRGGRDGTLALIVDPYRIWAQHLTLRVRQLTGLDYKDAGEAIARIRNRPIPYRRQTVAGWEAGESEVRLADFLALCELTQLGPRPLVEALLAMIPTPEDAVEQETQEGFTQTLGEPPEEELSDPPTLVPLDGFESGPLN